MTHLKEQSALQRPGPDANRAYRAMTLKMWDPIPRGPDGYVQVQQPGAGSPSSVPLTQDKLRGAL